jgi:hypothetical protein
MATSPTRGPGDRAAGAEGAFEGAQPQHEVLETMSSTADAMFDGMTKLNREIAEFVSERIRQDIETQQQLLRCRSFDEVASVQTRFLQTAMDQYSHKAQKLMRLGTEVLERSIARPS